MNKILNAGISISLLFAGSLLLADDVSTESVLTDAVEDITIDTDGGSYKYYTWSENSSGVMVLEYVEATTDPTSYENYYDFYVKYDPSAETSYVSQTGAAVDTNDNTYGGAIYNTEYRDEINYNFIDNTATYGGTIFNSNTASIAKIDSEFIGNESKIGGAIQNEGNITTINAYFVDNYASWYGGAIANYSYSADAHIGTINGDFIGNTAAYQGGAIYNTSGNAGFNATIDAIYGDFIGNSVTSSSNCYGGAIANMGYYYNNASSVATITLIEGNFIENYATTGGGAIYNKGAKSSGEAFIYTINGDFTQNSTSGSGGAIYNQYYAYIGTINGDFTQNSASKYGGAISNTDNSTINKIDGNFIGNYAGIYGGAIYTKGSDETVSLTLVSTTENNTYLGNFATSKTLTWNEDGTLATELESDDDKNGGFIYIDGGAVNFDTAAETSIIVGDGTVGYDSIAGTSSSIINKEGLGTLTVNSSMQYFYGTLNVNYGTMEVNNGLGASKINISSGATLSATINGDYTFSNSSLSISNDGTLKLIAGVGLTESDEYTIATNTSLDFDDDSIGAIAYGGTIDGNTFIVSAATATDMTTQTTVTDNGKIVINTSSSSSSVESVVMSFNASTATLNSVTDVSTSLETAIVSESSSITVLAAFDFDIALTSGDSVVLSFLVGDGYNLSDFTIYHSTNNTDWDVASEISDLTYDGEYLSFIVTSFSAYGVAVPEPSTYAMIFGALALGLAVYRRRK